MSDNRKEAEEKMAKAIFISGDGWLAVFDLLPPSQLGLGIALISHRFDFYVDEHFKTRKWALKFIQIRRKFRGNVSTNEMEIFHGKPLPIPQNQLPRKVTGFERIQLFYIDSNSIAFLQHFRRLFASCPINLCFNTNSDQTFELILRNIWPMIRKNICALQLRVGNFHRLRKYVPSCLNDCPSLRVFSFNCDGLFTEFPADDSAMASDGQAVAKWLFTPRPDNVPKLFKCWLIDDDANLTSKIDAFKAAFASASSPVNFIVTVFFPPDYADSVVPFVMTNEVTREQLSLKRNDNINHNFDDSNEDFLLVRSPIARDASKWTKWEKEAIGWVIFDGQWNFLGIFDDNPAGRAFRRNSL
ncbi:hypothetical protein niasHT_024560 [Heterodera trifolii]|uniref:Uncharacterized protein n=1 Tax=Heterodera trifolii TaxID=157864 RepID=A0ABD2K7F0_9BILA